MTKTCLPRRLLLTLPALTLLPRRLAAQTTAQEVQMLNVNPADKTQKMLFLPGVVRAQPGDTVTFRAVQKGHNAQSIEGLIPEGAEPFKGKINEEIELTLTVEGTYAYQCQPHSLMGMMGFLLVGNFTTNLPAVREGALALRGKETKARAETLLAEIDAIAAAEGLAG